MPSTASPKTDRYPAAHLPFESCEIYLSTSIPCPAGAFPRNSSNMPLSLALNASSAALFIMPHLSHISIRSFGVKEVHLGMKAAASLGLPEARRALK